jgi:hypothetical protein
VKMFDGEGFPIWSYHVEIFFEAKQLLHVVQGTKKRSTFPTAIANDRELTPTEEVKVSDWDKKNAKARMVISQCILQKVLGKLKGAFHAAAMWKKLVKLYLKKSPESLFTLMARFFDYKMLATDDISSHI